MTDTRTHEELTREWNRAHREVEEDERRRAYRIAREMLDRTSDEELMELDDEEDDDEMA
jgi:hypothetical protein